MTVLPDSRLVAQTMRLRAPAWACRNSCPYTLGRKCSGSAAHSLWSSDSAVGGSKGTLCPKDLFRESLLGDWGPKGTL